MTRRPIACAVLLVSTCAYAADLAGNYTGTWSSTTVSATGRLRLAVQKSTEGWRCQLAYLTPEQHEVVAKRLFCTVSGKRFTGQYEVDGDGGTSHIKLKAERTGKSLRGSYSETGADGRAADSGTWSVVVAR